jgi:RNA polymerase sigma factor (sigma-70 family)
LRAFRGLGNFSNGNARAWVLTIVRRTAYDWVQNNRAATLLPVDDLEGVKGAPSGELDAPATALIAKAEAALLRATIAALPPPFRETLVMRDLQGLVYREIAEVTEVPIGTVMWRLARARHRVITLIAKIWPQVAPE